MYGVSKIEIHKFDALYAYCDTLCHQANNMYNVTNYFFRQIYTYLTGGTVHTNQREVMNMVENSLPSMNEIKVKNFERSKKEDKKLKLFHLPTSKQSSVSYDFLDAFFKQIKQSDYYAMPSQTNQQSMKKVFDDWKSYFKGLAAYKKHPSRFTGKPKMPRYKHKGGKTTCYLTNQICKVENDRFLTFPKTDLHLDLGRVGSFNGKLQQVRIVPTYGFYTVEVVFKNKPSSKAIVRPESNPNDFVFTPKRVMSIDMGVDNLATITDNEGHIPLLVKGTWLKAANQWYNKERARLFSILRNGKQPNEGEFTSKRLLHMDSKRSRQMQDYMHKASKYVVSVALARNIDTIVVGSNPLWKQGVSMSHTSNQNFVQIPHSQFISMVKYKAEREGIQVIKKEESYTSKASFLHDDIIPTYGDDVSDIAFSGYRASRAMYKINGESTTLHADVNGSLNIGRKHVPSAYLHTPKEAFLKTPTSMSFAWTKKHKHVTSTTLV